MGKGYLEHEVNVRYMDGILNKSKEWNWFVEYIEENYNFQDISTWNEFVKRKKELLDVYSFFISIIQVSDQELVFSSSICHELYCIASFYLGKEQKEKVFSQLHSNFSKVFSFIVWITKLENQRSEMSYIFDIRVMEEHNIFELENLSNLQLYESEIIKYLSEIKITGLELPKSCLMDNIHEKFHEINIEAIEEHREELLSYNAFSFKKIDVKEISSWEEKFIFDMVRVKIKDRKLIPFLVSEGISNPNTEEWTVEIIQTLKTRFNNEIVDFILETISYVKYQKEPSKQTIFKHIHLLKEKLLDFNNERFHIECSSFQIISYLFKDRILNKYASEEEFIDMIKQFHQITNIQQLGIIKVAGIPLSPRQSNMLKKYYDEQYKNIDYINFSNDLVKYFQNKDVVKTIENSYFEKVINKFNDSLKEKDNRMIPNLFYYYMIFLIRLKQQALNVDKQHIMFEMIRIQKLWEDKYYNSTEGSLQRIEQVKSIPSKEVEQYNDSVLENVFLVTQCMLVNKSEIIKEMEMVSEQPILYLCSTMYIEKIFPVLQRKSINYERHEIDKTFRGMVESVVKDYGYRFLNILDIDIYVQDIHKKCMNDILIYTGMFYKVSELYNNLVKELKEFKLLPYSDEIVLGHVTQLFPILEYKIRELGAMINIVPFKESEREFMKYKDPSSILREILLLVYKELGDYENVGDILFVYDFMYNGESLNIRNECIHCRNYTEGSELNFAFKITMFSLKLILKRIEIIKHNME